MTNENNTKTNTIPSVVSTENSAPKVNPQVFPSNNQKRNTRFDPSNRSRRGGSQKRETKERAKPEFDSKMLNIRRVTRVTKGGRRLSFSVAMVAGDRKGRVGVGLGKAGDTSLAIDKATRDAKKNMVKISLTSNQSIPHQVEAKYSSARILIIPVKGRGLVAGSALRTVAELAGLNDVTAKILSGSKNKLNIARAAIMALRSVTKHQKAFVLKDK